MTSSLNYLERMFHSGKSTPGGYAAVGVTSSVPFSGTFPILYSRHGVFFWGGKYLIHGGTGHRNLLHLIEASV